MLKFGLLVALRPSTASADVDMYIVPTMLKAPAVPPSLLPDASADARTAYIAFGAEPNKLQFRDKIWPLGSTACTFQLGFLPPALLPRLQAKVVAWGQRVGGEDSVPQISRGVIEVCVGTLHFKLEQLPGQPCLRLTVLQPGTAHLVLRRVEEMVEEVKRECMPHLEFFAALPVPQLDESLEADARAAGERYLVPLSRVRASSRSQQPLKSASGQVLDDAQFADWLPPLPRPLDWYHVMISYRQATEKPFAQGLFDALAQYEASAGQAIRTFLDQERLQDGQRWDLTIAKAMLHTILFVPIVSAGSVGGMAERFEAAPDKVDYVLLEWMLALELEERGVIKSICPLMVGALDAEGDGSGAADDGAAAPRMSNFMADGHLARVPDAVSTATCAKLEELLAQVGAPPLSRRRTAREVVDTIVAFQGVSVWDFKATHGRADQPMLGWGVHEECAKRIKPMLTAAGGAMMEDMGKKSDAIAAAEEGLRGTMGADEKGALASQLDELKEQMGLLLKGQQTAPLMLALPNGKKCHVFLSHSKACTNTPRLVRMIKTYLEGKGCVVFFDIDDLIDISKEELQTKKNGEEDGGGAADLGSARG